MYIKSIEVTHQNDKLILSATIKSSVLGSKNLWFSVPELYEQHVCTTQMDAFLVGMLFPAMMCGEDLYIDGIVSKKLIFNINKYVIPLLISFCPTAKKIKVSAKELSEQFFDNTGIGTGFSGGVDSFNAIHELFVKQNDIGLRVNTLLFLNVGSHGSKEESAKVKYLQRYNHLKNYPKEVNLDYIPIDSNLHTFHPWGHEKIHTLTGCAGVLVLQKHFSKYYYASAGFNYTQIINFSKKYRDKDIGIYCDPILLPLLSTESTEFYQEGAAYSRVDKIVDISNYEPTYRYLNVCVSGDDTHENCSTCNKCLRTLFALDLSGNLNKYENIFDIKKYKKVKGFYIAQLIQDSKKDIFAQSLIELAKEKGVKIPNKIVSKVKFFYYRKIIRKLKKIGLI